MKKNVLIILSLFCAFTAVAFFYPRGLVTFLGETHFLSSYLYIYGLGIPFFILGITLLIRSKALNLQVKGEKKWLSYFIFGFAWSLTAHGIWIWIAVWFPFVA